MKTCRSCEGVKPFSDFQKNRHKKDGLQADCRPCRKVVDAESWRRNRDARQARKGQLRREIVEEVRRLKAETPCADCGGRFHSVSMQFDHRPGESKHADVATLCRNGARQATWREIAKCDIVCANCHAVRTYERQVQHGADPDDAALRDVAQ